MEPGQDIDLAALCAACVCSEIASRTGLTGGQPRGQVTETPCKRSILKLRARVRSSRHALTPWSHRPCGLRPPVASCRPRLRAVSFAAHWVCTHRAFAAVHRRARIGPSTPSPTALRPWAPRRPWDSVVQTGYGGTPPNLTWSGRAGERGVRGWLGVRSNGAG